MNPEDQIDAIVGAVLEQAGVEMVEDARGRLSDDYAGTSSKPGEYPKKRSGNLRDGIEAIVTRDGSVMTLTVVSTSPYSVYLKDSGRLLLDPVLEDWTPTVTARLTQALSA